MVVVAHTAHECLSFLFVFLSFLPNPHKRNTIPPQSHNQKGYLLNNLTDQLAKERKERKEAAVAGKAGVEGTEAAAAAAAAKKGKEKGKEKEKEAGQARTKPNRYPTGIQSNRGPWWVPRPPQRWDHGTSTIVLS